MSTAKQVSRWFKRLFILVIMLMICLSGVVFLARNEIMSSGQSLTLGLMLIFAVIIIQRQMEISRDIRLMKAQSAALIHYEDDIKRRLEELTLQVNSMEAPPLLQSDHSEAIAILNSRINSLQVEVDRPSEERESADFHPVEQFPTPEARTKANSKNRSNRHRGSPVLDEKSLNMHLQPIVELPSRRPAYFDAFMRLNDDDGGFIDQTEFRKLAATAGLMPTIDKKIVFSAVRMVRKLNLLKKKAGVFCPISPKSLLNLHTFREISTFLEANREIRDSVIIELTQREFRGLNQEQRDRLSELSELGVALSMKDVQDLSIDPQKLSKSGFRFIKIPTSILLHASIDATAKGIQPANLVAVLEVENIQLIATEVERDRDAINLIDMDLPLAQGLLFAPPRPVKAELLLNAEPARRMKLKSSA